MAEIEVYDPASGAFMGYQTVEDAPVVATAKPVLTTAPKPVTQDYAFTGTDTMPDITGGTDTNYTVASTPTPLAPVGIDFTSLFDKSALNNYATQFGNAATGAVLRAGDTYMASHTLDENLEYLKGFVPADQRAEMNAFVAVINEHPDTKAALDAALRDEGLTGVLELKNSFSGKDGLFNAAEFKEMMADDAYRGFINSALTQTGTEAVTAKDLAELTRRAIQVKKDPMNTEAFKALTQQADSMGVTGLTNIQSAEAMNMIGDMWAKFQSDPEGFFQDLNKMIVGFVDSMGLPENYRDMLVGTLSGGAWATTSLASDILNGPNGEPGALEVGAQIGEALTQSGQQYRSLGLG